MPIATQFATKQVIVESILIVTRAHCNVICDETGFVEIMVIVTGTHCDVIAKNCCRNYDDGDASSPLGFSILSDRPSKICIWIFLPTVVVESMVMMMRDACPLGRNLQRNRLLSRE